ncbi:Integrin beta-like protein 1, partial [Characodon lateralis]|nr:Integrin beta-like protein 1 [Characodon lateralis]
MLVPFFLILLSTFEDVLLQSVSQVGQVCRLSQESSLRRCRTPDGKICSGRGKCDCGMCMCEVTDPGRFFGPR